MKPAGPYRYFAAYKPYGVICQFTPEQPGQITLADVFDLPPGVYPLGRLDQDSEGLLLLSDDPALNHRLLDPKYRHRRSYWAQVEGIPDEAVLQKLRDGVEISVNSARYRTLPAQAELLESPPPLPERHPPVRFRRAIPTAWLRLTLTEGKNRQVRRMCAAAGCPVLRLVRQAIEALELGDLPPGGLREIPYPELRRRLRL
jgi:23S rRNA pseudouridine2457 synthase